MLRPSRHGLFYGCTNYPRCNATHGAHPNGAPLGVPANKATKAARMRLHAVFDLLWKGRKGARKPAYAWLRGAMGMDDAACHIANFDIETCERAIALVHEELGRRGIAAEPTEN